MPARSSAAPFTVAALVAAALFTGAPRPLPVQEGWRPLFNGTDLSGWTNINCAPETFSVKDGMIHSTGAPICEMRTDRMYENFELELEYQHLKAGGNAGIFIWADAMPARGQPFLRAIEVQVLDGQETKNYTSHGDIFPIHGAVMTPDRPHPGGWVRSLPREKRAKPAGQWNHYRIVANRGSISLAVNGAVVTEGSAASPRKGYIAIESEGSPALFRNLRIKELAPDPALTAAETATADEGFTSLYTGVDLRGWKIVDADKGKWTVKDWILAYTPTDQAAAATSGAAAQPGQPDRGADRGAGLQPGPGALASERLFRDVVVRFDWRIAEKTPLPARGVPPPERVLGAGGAIGLGPGPATEAGRWHRTELTVAGLTFKSSVDGLSGLNGGIVLGAGGSVPPAAERPLVLDPGPWPVEFANIFVKPLP